MSTDQSLAVPGGRDVVPAKRAAVPQLATPFPLREQVPAMIMDDPFACRFLDGLDEVIAPVISVLDCFDAYLDPDIAPLDMVQYLGTWLLATLDDPWDDATMRRDVGQAHYRAQTAGTNAGLYNRLVPHLVKSVSIRDTGTTTASKVATDPADWADAPAPVVKIVLLPHAGKPVDLVHIERIVRDAIPAHVGLELSST